MIDALYPYEKQIEVLDIGELAIMIGKCESVREINELRLTTVKTQNVLVMKLWQEKFWSLKNCPTCGKAR